MHAPIMAGFRATATSCAGMGMISGTHPVNSAEILRGFSPKTEIEPRITRIDTDYEEVAKTRSKPVW
jgi:hypothetical protein